MRLSVLLIAVTSILFAATSAQAGKSCSTFSKISGFDDAAQTITLEKAKGSEKKFFPKTDGAPTASKIPAKCKSKVLGEGSFAVKSTGGRLSITQVRSNFEGKMLNDPDDKAWVGAKIKEIVAASEIVVVVLRQPPGAPKDAPHQVTTIYMPITPEEEAEIERLNNIGEDQ